MQPDRVDRRTRLGFGILARMTIGRDGNCERAIVVPDDLHAQLVPVLALLEAVVGNGVPFPSGIALAPGPLGGRPVASMGFRGIAHDRDGVANAQ
jgi:hypothetical protein